MSTILIVQGMNTRRKDADYFRGKYFAAVRGLIERTAQQTGTEIRLPEPSDVAHLYWTDLVPTELPPTTKGAIEDLEDAFYAYIRKLPVMLDRGAEYDLTKPAPNWIGNALRPKIAQTAMYMGHLPAAYQAYDNVDGSLRSQVLERFDRLLTQHRGIKIVIGHSLGSVIAYEALAQKPHAVDLLMTVGSPITTPRLIYDRLVGSPPYPWPNVLRWCNVYSVRDWFFAPIPKLDGLFDGGRIEDLCVRHGLPWNPEVTHKLPSYFQHAEVGKVLLEAWRDTLSPPKVRCPERPTASKNVA